MAKTIKELLNEDEEVLIETEDHDEDDEQMLLAIEMLNRLAEANRKIATGRGVVQRLAIELPQKQPKQIETKAGITGELIGEIEQLLKLMPNG
jgi:hypothetical protein